MTTTRHHPPTQATGHREAVQLYDLGAMDGPRWHGGYPCQYFGQAGARRADIYRRGSDSTQPMGWAETRRYRTPTRLSIPLHFGPYAVQRMRKRSASTGQPFRRAEVTVCADPGCGGAATPRKSLSIGSIYITSPQQKENHEKVTLPIRRHFGQAASVSRPEQSARRTESLNTGERSSRAGVAKPARLSIQIMPGRTPGNQEIRPPPGPSISPHPNKRNTMTK